MTSVECVLKVMSRIHLIYCLPRLSTYFDIVFYRDFRIKIEKSIKKYKCCVKKKSHLSKSLFSFYSNLLIDLTCYTISGFHLDFLYENYVYINIIIELLQ